MSICEKWYNNQQLGAFLRISSQSLGQLCVQNRFDPVRNSIRDNNMAEKGKISNGVDGGLEHYYTGLPMWVVIV